MKKKKPYMLINQFEYGEDVLEMSPHEAGELFQALMRYVLTGKKTIFKDRYNARIFKGMTNDINLHFEHYSEISIKNSINRRIGIANKDEQKMTALKNEKAYFNENGLKAYVQKYNTKKQALTSVTTVNECNQVEDEAEDEVEDEAEVEAEENNNTLSGDLVLSPVIEPEIITKNEEIKNKYRADAEFIIDYLNKRTGRKYRKVESNIRPIIARFKEGYTVSEVKTVIDKKCVEWMNSEKMSQYLRPQTLFSTKFDSYLNAPVAKQKGQNLAF